MSALEIVKEEDTKEELELELEGYEISVIAYWGMSDRQPIEGHSQ